MRRRPPRSTRTYTLFPCTSLIRSVPIGDSMVHRRNMVLLDADLPPHEIVQQVLASPHTRIPVWRGEPENVIGVLHAKDLLRALAFCWMWGSPRSEEHTSELQSLMRISYAVFCLKKKKRIQ